MRVRRETLLFVIISLFVSAVALLWVALFPPEKKPVQTAITESPKVYMISLQRGPENFEKVEGGYIAVEPTGTETFLPEERTYIHFIDSLPGIDSYVMADEDATGTLYTAYLKKTKHREDEYEDGKGKMY